MLSSVSVSTRTLTSQGIGFLVTSRKPSQFIYLKIILITPGIIRSLKFKKKKKNGGIVELLIPTFFQKKKLLMRGVKTFLGKKVVGRLFLIGGLMIRSCQGL